MGYTCFNVGDKKKNACLLSIYLYTACILKNGTNFKNSKAHYSKYFLYKNQGILSIFICMDLYGVSLHAKFLYAKNNKT